MSAFDTLLSFLEAAIPVVLAIVLHEIAHGCVAFYFGDTTAKDMKRLSLNPLCHVDPVGTLLFPLILILTNTPFIFGWAKPVPVNINRLKNPKKDMFWVALAGPAMNFILAMLCFLIISLSKNVFHLALSNGVFAILVNMIVFNFSIMLFNLIPVLPLDGGRMLVSLLPYPLAFHFAKTEKYGFIVIALLLIFLPVLGDHTGYDLNFIAYFLSGGVRALFKFFAGFFGLA